MIDELISKLRTESLYTEKATLEIMDLCMEAALQLEILNVFQNSQCAKLLARVGELEKKNNVLKKALRSAIAEHSVDTAQIERLMDFYIKLETPRNSVEGE